MASLWLVENSSQVPGDVLLLTHPLIIEAFLQVASRIKGHDWRVNGSSCYTHGSNEKKSYGGQLHIVVGDGYLGRACLGLGSLYLSIRVEVLWVLDSRGMIVAQTHSYVLLVWQ